MRFTEVCNVGELHLICIKTESFHAKYRCNSNDISYLSET